MMPSGHCAICDNDNDSRELCPMHGWLAHMRTLVMTGAWSDWPYPTGVGPFVSERLMLCSVSAAEPTPWQASILTVLTAKGAWWEHPTDDQPETFFDWLADNDLIDWRRINGSGNSGKAA